MEKLAIIASSAARRASCEEVWLTAAEAAAYLFTHMLRSHPQLRELTSANVYFSTK